MFWKYVRNGENGWRIKNIEQNTAMDYGGAGWSNIYALYVLSALCGNGNKSEDSVRVRPFSV